jgi:hypothetical protein
MGKSTCGKNFQLYEMRVLVILFSIVNPSDGNSRKARRLQRFGARGNGGTASSNVQLQQLQISSKAAQRETILVMPSSQCNLPYLISSGIPPAQSVTHFTSTYIAIGKYISS